MKRVSDPGVLRWLEERTPRGEVTGYDAVGWQANVWILHAMYETEKLPAGISHDDVYRIERAVAARDHEMDSEPDIHAVLDELLPDATITGSPLGRAGWPGPGYKRLRWRELGERLGIDPLTRRAPSSESFPYSSWPVNLAPPPEGSLDREQFEQLVEHLAAVTPGGQLGRCFAFYAVCAGGDWDEPVVYAGELRELLELYEAEDFPGSPSNIWPTTKDWFVYTDWDLWATKVSGPVALIDHLVADPELEAAALNL